MNLVGSRLLDSPAHVNVAHELDCVGEDLTSRSRASKRVHWVCLGTGLLGSNMSKGHKSGMGLLVSSVWRRPAHEKGLLDSGEQDVFAQACVDSVMTQGLLDS